MRMEDMFIYLKGDNPPVDKMIKRLAELGAPDAEQEQDTIYIDFNGTYNEARAIIEQIENEFEDDMDGWY